MVVGVFVGLATLDVLHYVDRLPGPNEKVTAAEQALAAGGPAANAAVTFAALGGAAVLVTALGSGAAASLIRADLVQHGVDVRDANPEASGEAPVSSILVSAGSGNRAVVGIDATAAVVPAWAGMREVVGAASVVLVDGHHAQLALQAARAARTNGVPVVLDAGRWKPAMVDLLPLTDEAICSADFRLPNAESTPAALIAAGIAIVAVTAGPRPIQWWHRGSSGRVAPPEISAVDTLGAGDVFHGAYCFFRASGEGVEGALSRAAEVAAMRCTVRGPRRWLPLR